MAKQVSHSNLAAAAALVAAASTHALARKGGPVVVAIDGPSGGGKSTLTRAVGEIVGAVVVPIVDFFDMGISSAEWDRLSLAERARDAIDWKRLRQEALEPLLAGEPARWRGFDLTPGRPETTFSLSPQQLMDHAAAPVILLEGAYSSKPELADLLSLTVLVEAPVEVRGARLRAREEDPFLREFRESWDAAVAYYFDYIRPRASFDLIVSMGNESRPKV